MITNVMDNGRKKKKTVSDKKIDRKGKGLLLKKEKKKTSSDSYLKFKIHQTDRSQNK